MVLIYTSWIYAFLNNSFPRCEDLSRSFDRCGSQICHSTMVFLAFSLFFLSLKTTILSFSIFFCFSLRKNLNVCVFTGRGMKQYENPWLEVSFCQLPSIFFNVLEVYLNRFTDFSVSMYKQANVSRKKCNFYIFL